MIRDDVALAPKFVVSIGILDLAKGLTPVRAIVRAPRANTIDNVANPAVFWNQCARRIEQPSHIALDKRRRHERGDNLRAIDRLSVMRDACGAAREFRRFCRIARADHAPAVDKNLRSDLLGDNGSVQRRAATARRVDTVLQTQIGGVFCRYPQAAPPENRAILDNRVQPPVPDLFWRKSTGIAVFREGAQECKRARDIVVGDDKRLAQALVDIVVDFAELVLDPLVAPAFERTSQVDADNFAQNTCVDALFVIIGKRNASLCY